MSLARLGPDSDVYVDEVDPGFECRRCSREKVTFFHVDTLAGMAEHLLEHRRRGDKVPERAFELLREGLASE